MLIQLSSAHQTNSDKYNTDDEVHSPPGEHHGFTDPAFIFKSFETFQQARAESSSVAPAVMYDTPEVSNLQSVSIIVSTMQPLQPPLPPSIQISLTVIYIFMFSVLFLLVYVQLGMIWYYRHKRLSHQTLFLFLCLVWAGLRTVLFSYYIRDRVAVNNLNTALYWLLNSLPVCLQFGMLCLLIHFILQVMLKARAKYEPRQCMYPLHLFIVLSVIIFTSVSLASAVITKKYKFALTTVPSYVIYVRVIISEVMFFIYGVLLSISLYKMAKMASTQKVLEAKGTTIRKALVAAILITLLFLSRTLYNFISMCPTVKKIPNLGFDWINISNKPEVTVKLPETLAYVSFGVVLFIWEVLPISIVVIFFRVKRLNTGQVLTNFSTQISGSRVFFFDNPRRYDSDDDLNSQPSSSYNDAVGSHSYSSDSCFTPCSERTPINSSLRAIVGASPSLMNFPRAASSLPGSSPFPSFKRGNNYGALSGEGSIHTKPSSADGTHSK